MLLNNSSITTRDVPPGISDKFYCFKYSFVIAGIWIGYDIRKFTFDENERSGDDACIVAEQKTTQRGE